MTHGDDTDQSSLADDRRKARSLDAADPLTDFRRRFVFDDSDLVYVDGNSLGRMPTASKAVLDDLVDRQWSQRLIRGWADDPSWLDLPHRVGAKIAGIIGAKPHEVVVADSTTVNFFKLSVAALQYQMRDEASGQRLTRNTVVTDDLNFPSDVHSLAATVDLLDKGHQLKVLRSADGQHIPTRDVADALDQSTALLTLSHVVFKSGYLYDMAALTEAAHDAGALTLWDLSHSVGSVDVKLNECGADLAVGCTYKYLNGGPGAPAFIYVSESLQDQLPNPVAGWMGAQSRFDFELDHQPENGVGRFLTGTPSVLSMALVEPGVDLVLEAGIDKIRAKSIELGRFFAELWERHLQPHGFRFQSPVDADQRGGHISLGHDDGLAIDLALIKDLNVIGDFRAPDNLRLGFAPLYTSFEDLHELTVRLVKAMEDDLHASYSDASVTVT